MPDRKQVNHYSRQLTFIERTLRLHRVAVGGLWEEVGKLQYDFMVDHGLKPESTLLDVGCGALRGGVHFARYLDDGNYYGIDINRSLLKAGRSELNRAGIKTKQVHLHQTDTFEATVFDTKFDYGISVSLLSHLAANQIIYCFMQMQRVMHPDSRFFFTYFEAPTITDSHEQGTLTTHFLSDPFHYTWEQMEFFARNTGLSAHRIGNWNHPRNQLMMEVRLP